MVQQIGKTAVVIGGSMAGLLAARVLADYYDRVTILERDILPITAQPRKGVPQGGHAHVLLARGQEALEELFPGLTQDLIDRGAVQGHGRFFAAGGYLCRVQDGPGGVFVSRPCLETAVRGRLLSLPNVQLIENCDVQGLLASNDRTRVTGVLVVRRLPVPIEDTVPADLVVDASGRGSRTPMWLEQMGYRKPEVDLVEVGMGYSSRFYRRQPDHLAGDLVVNVAPSRENTRACGMLAQEDDRWIVTLAGYFGDHPPTDEQGFLAFARSLPVSDVYDVIRTTTPLTDPLPYKFRANKRHRYERLARFPEGFLVIGDAIASFTPIYGQGMTVAALEALALRRCLGAGTQRLSQRFFRQAGKEVDIAWSITVGNDLHLSMTKASRRPSTWFINWYMTRLQIAARVDPKLALAFLRVASMMEAPPSLFHPRIALRVLRANPWMVSRTRNNATRHEPRSQLTGS